VLGNGFGVIYPAAIRACTSDGDARLPRHRASPGERRTPALPRRNRLISGLSRAVVVIEADARSGALVTANEGLEQGRAILAVPGPITSARRSAATD